MTAERTRIIREFRKIVLENLAGQVLVVKILRPRQLRNAGLETTFDRIPDDVICRAVPVAGEQNLSILQPFFCQILQICPIHQQGQDT